MVETTTQGIILTANSALALALGFDSPAQLIGRQITRFYADDTRRAEFLAALAEKGFVEGFETKYVRRDGAVGLASVSARAERDPEGNMVLIQSIPHDITERRMAEQEREHAREAEKLLARSQLETLRYQVNPHFLFNTLNSIDALSHEAPDRIPALLGELTDYLRFSLQPRQGDLAPLRRELEAIGAYLAIEKVRFAENLQVTIEASEEAQAQLVPELVLQPLVENAIEHGMPTSPLPLRLVVRIRRDRGRLRIVVSNTGRWSGPETERYGRGHVGLSNLRSRLELLYPGSYRLEVKERKGWVTVSVELPGEEANSEWRIDDGRCHCTDC
jgi:PAS domain S-box-containing protein